MKQTLTVEALQTLSIEEGDVLVVTVDVNDVPPSQAQRFMESTKDFLKTVVDCKVMVIPSSIKLTKINGKVINDESDSKKSS